MWVFLLNNIQLCRPTKSLKCQTKCIFLPSGPNESTSSHSVWMATHGMEGVCFIFLFSVPSICMCVWIIYTTTSYFSYDGTSCEMDLIKNYGSYILKSRFKNTGRTNMSDQASAGPIFLLGPVQDIVYFYIFCVLLSNILTVQFNIMPDDVIVVPQTVKIGIGLVSKTLYEISNHKNYSTFIVFQDHSSHIYFHMFENSDKKWIL